MARRYDEKGLKRKNAWKGIRTVFQVFLLILVALWVVWSLQTRPVKKDPEEETAAAQWKQAEDGTVTDASGTVRKDAVGINPVNGTPQIAVSARSVLSDAEPSVNAEEGARFICVSYNGINTSDKLDSKIVNLENFKLQASLLAQSGYVTVSQQDVLNYYNEHAGLPDKAMLLLFEDGIYDTATLVQPTIERYNYKSTMCTYSSNLGDTEGLYLTAQNVKDLIGTTFWEIGSNGYRLSYINVFDRYRNYFGHLNQKEHHAVRSYLRRDYNHYLMDFLRDKDRLREESEAEMRRRISWDYEQMREDYTQEGEIPALYVLMHSNTRAFGNDELVSEQNELEMSRLFKMNFNRQGSCLNTSESSIWDLTRLESRHYFSPNHLMMRIWDDTGDNVSFLAGDTEAAGRWNVSGGVADMEGDRIILTTLPYGEAVMCLKDALPKNPDLTVTLQGNVVGKQAVVLGAAEDGSSGISVSLENNYLVVRSMADPDVKLYEMNLFEFDGGPFISREQDELNGLIALQRAIIEFDEDPERIRKAEAILPDLEAMTVVNIEEGGEPYYPELDISQRDERKLRIQQNGNELNVWLDDRPVLEKFRVPATPESRLLLCGAVSNDTERFSRENLDDDVYDAVFINLTIRDGQGQEFFSYASPEQTEPAEEETEEAEPEQEERISFTDWLRNLVGLGRKED